MQPQFRWVQSPDCFESILHGNAIIPSKADPSALPNPFAEWTRPIDIEIERQLKVRCKRLYTVHGTAVHDPQTLFLGSQVRLRSSSMRHG
jgi:hypothetical protein